MIITTVVLFLRDLLPVFILFCYLTVFFEPKKWFKSVGIVALMLGVIGTLFFFVIAEVISEWFEGAGIELLRVLLIFITYLCLFFSDSLITTYQVLPKHTGSCKKIANFILGIFIVGITAFIILKGSAFLIFFDVYLQQKDSLVNILIGCFVGLGICISFSALFTFLLIELKQNKLRIIVSVLWCLFLAGQLSHVIAYLSQVDIVVIESPMFNLEHYVKDSSEYGHILKALFGYESSPSKTFIWVYIVAFMVPLIINHYINSNVNKATEKAHHE
jgi:high-affinity iron transporter